MFIFSNFLLIEIMLFNIYSNDLLSFSEVRTFMYRAFLLFEISSYLLAISSSILYRLKITYMFYLYKMKPLTIDSFKPHKIRAVSSDKKSVDDFSYTSVRFEYDGDKIPPLRIDGSFRISKFKNSKGLIYSLSINCDESLEEFFNELRGVIANEICRLVPKVNGKRLSPDSFELVKSGKHGQNVYTKIYTRTSGKAKCKVSGLVENG